MNAGYLDGELIFRKPILRRLLELEVAGIVEFSNRWHSLCGFNLNKQICRELYGKKRVSYEL